MLKRGVAILIAVIVPGIAAAHVVRHPSLPQPFWGTWAPASAACDGAADAVTLSANAYAAGKTTCTIEAVSETPSPKGSTYSARMRCQTPAKGKKAVATNLIIRADATEQVFIGATFARLRSFQRCPAAKQQAGR
jgi:hypothetical protein